MFENILRESFENTTFKFVDYGFGWTQVGSEWKNDERWELEADPFWWEVDLFDYKNLTLKEIEEAVGSCKFVVAEDDETGQEIVVSPFLENIFFDFDPTKVTLKGCWREENVW